MILNSLARYSTNDVVYDGLSKKKTLKVFFLKQVKDQGHDDFFGRF